MDQSLSGGSDAPSRIILTVTCLFLESSNMQGNYSMRGSSVSLSLHKNFQLGHEIWHNHVHGVVPFTALTGTRSEASCPLFLHNY